MPRPDARTAASTCAPDAGRCAVCPSTISRFSEAGRGCSRRFRSSHEEESCNVADRSVHGDSRPDKNPAPRNLIVARLPSTAAGAAGCWTGPDLRRVMPYAIASPVIDGSATVIERFCRMRLLRRECPWSPKRRRKPHESPCSRRRSPTTTSLTRSADPAAGAVAEYPQPAGPAGEERRTTETRTARDTVGAPRWWWKGWGWRRPRGQTEV